MHQAAPAIDVFADYQRPARPRSAPALGQAPAEGGGGKLLLWVVLIAAMGAGAWWIYKKYEDENEGDDRRDEKSWWVKLYDHERGHQDRELKSVEGPFGTKSEAMDVAKENEDVWYPAVALSDQNPLETEH